MIARVRRWSEEVASQLASLLMMAIQALPDARADRVASEAETRRPRPR